MSAFGPLERIENPFSFDVQVDDLDLRLGLSRGYPSPLDGARERVKKLLAEHGLEYDWTRLRFVVGDYDRATRMTTVRCLYDI